MKHRVKNSESGVALLSALFALLLLSAVALGLVYVAGTESQVNYNYRNEQIAYFAAKAGVEEARDRMIYNTGNPTYYFGASTTLPINTLPPSAGSVVYLLNPGTPTESVTPWTFSNSLYPDDEICHDGYAFTNYPQVQPDLRCQTSPSDSGYYTTLSSAAPWSGTTAAMAYKWVRIALKVNNTEQDYPVVGPVSSSNSGTQVCFDGQYERLLAAPATSCDQMPTAKQTTMTPVYVLTALAVAPNGARKMVQAEVARQPSQDFPYGMYADGTIGCGVLAPLYLAGGATTDSFTTANGGTYATTHSNTGGNVGSNGNVDLEGNPTTVGGSIAVLAVPPATQATQGPCGLNNYTNNGGGMISNSNNVLTTLSQPVTFAPPPTPTGPQNVAYPLPTCGSGSGSGKGNGKGGGGGGGGGSGTTYCMVAGTYGNINLNANSSLQLAPGVYNINSIVVGGGANITVVPPGQVILNVLGSGFTATSTTQPVQLTGNSISNSTGIANDFQVNYAGTVPITVAGGSTTYMVVYAPNAAVSLKGGSDFYGAILGNTVNDAGGVAFHYDKNTHLTTTPSTAPLQMISFRDVSY